MGNSQNHAKCTQPHLFYKRSKCFVYRDYRKVINFFVASEVGIENVKFVIIAKRFSTLDLLWWRVCVLYNKLDRGQTPVLLSSQSFWQSQLLPTLEWDTHPPHSFLTVLRRADQRLCEVLQFGPSGDQLRLAEVLKVLTSWNSPLKRTLLRILGRLRTATFLGLW